MKSSESNPPVKTKPREAEAGPEEEAFPEELMRLARPPRGITAEVKDGVLTIRRRWYVALQEELIGDGFVGLIVGLIFGRFFGPFLGLIFGLFVGLIFGVFVDPIVGLFCGPFLGLIFGLFVGPIVGRSRNAEPTALMAAGDVLQVKYSLPGPLASREIRTDMINQIFVVASPSLVEEHNDQDDKTFKVRARLHSGEHVVLFEDLTKPEAKFIEHRLEAFLGIANQRVEWEVED